MDPSPEDSALWDRSWFLDSIERALTEGERPVLSAVIAALRGRSIDARGLLVAAGRLHHLPEPGPMSGPPREQVVAAALALDRAAEVEEDPEARAIVEYHLGWVHLHAGEGEEALGCARRATRHLGADESPDGELVRMVTGLRGAAASSRQRWGEARDALSLALDGETDPNARVAMLSDLLRALDGLCESDEGIAACARELLDAAHRVGGDRFVVQARIVLGRCAWISGDLLGARDHLTVAVLLSVSDPDDWWQRAEASSVLGEIERDLGALPQAESELGRAASLLLRRGQPELRAWVLEQLGRVRQERGDYAGGTRALLGAAREHLSAGQRSLALVCLWGALRGRWLTAMAQRRALVQPAVAAGLIGLAAVSEQIAGTLLPFAAFSLGIGGLAGAAAGLELRWAARG